MNQVLTILFRLMLLPYVEEFIDEKCPNQDKQQILDCMKDVDGGKFDPSKFDKQEMFKKMCDAHDTCVTEYVHTYIYYLTCRLW